MISKFAKINNVFSYSFFEWDKINLHSFTDKNGDLKSFDGAFKKKNIIFGENGNGKSKLVNLFKSLDGQNISIEKHRDRKTDNQEIKVCLSDNLEIDSDGEKWTPNSLEKKFLIFDKYYIDSFVHSIGPSEVDTPQRRQQRGRNIIYLGDFAEYNREIDKVVSVKNRIQEKNETFLNDEISKIELLLRGVGINATDLEQNKELINKLDKKILPKKKADLEKNRSEEKKLENAIKEKTKIANLSPLLEIKIEPTNDINAEELFSFSVARGVQATLHKISHKEDFISKGVSLLGDDISICPFCEQNIKKDDYIPIIKDYQEIFDAAFNAEEEKVRSLLLIYKGNLQNLIDLQAPKDNFSKFNQAKEFIDALEEPTPLGITDEEKATIKDEIERIFKKEQKITDKITDSKWQTIIEIFKQYQIAIKKYNGIIQIINKKIEQCKTDAGEGKFEGKLLEIRNSISDLKNEIFFIENQTAFKKYFEALKIQANNKKIVDSLERVYQVLKTNIVDEFNKFVDEYFQLLAKFVKEISPSMEILTMEGHGTFDRRNLQDPAQCGFQVKYNGQDCTLGLSEGERQVIALAFFLAHLNKENDKNKIVVFDDPITSFDAGKRKSTAELIRRETDGFEQLFIFTCDPLFREYCLKQIPNDRNFYYIFKTKGSSSIHYVPKERETIYDTFESEFRTIDEVLGTSENVVVYGQKLRFCLETKIKEDYFGYSEDSLSNMIRKVTGRAKTDFDRLFLNKEEILEIYSYCNTGGLAHYPKDGSTSWNELIDKIKRYLALGL